MSSAKAPAHGVLYLVSTPIGNLGDMSHRAVEVLSSAALVIAEDTRHSRRLLDHYRIETPLSSYHEHNEAKETPRLVARLQRGDSIALISDAGTPLISDPGSRLVEAAVAAGLTVPDHARGRLEKDQRLLGNLVAQLLGVLAIVAADANDFSGA